MRNNSNARLFVCFCGNEFVFAKPCLLSGNQLPGPGASDTTRAVPDVQTAYPIRAAGMQSPPVPEATHAAPGLPPRTKGVPAPRTAGLVPRMEPTVPQPTRAAPRTPVSPRVQHTASATPKAASKAPRAGPVGKKSVPGDEAGFHGVPDLIRTVPDQNPPHQVTRPGQGQPDSKLRPAPVLPEAARKARAANQPRHEPNSNDQLAISSRTDPGRPGPAADKRGSSGQKGKGPQVRFSKTSDPSKRKTSQTTAGGKKQEVARTQNGSGTSGNSGKNKGTKPTPAARG